MRKIKFEDWVKEKSNSKIKREGKGRPTKEWKLLDSIRYIKMRDEYLKEENILVERGKRKFRLNI